MIPASRKPSSLRVCPSCCRVAATVLLLMALAGAAWAQEESLGDYARHLQSKKTVEVLISPEDGARLFKDVDVITQFSSQDSGLPRLAPVKRKLIGQAEAEDHFRRQSQDQAQQEYRIDQSAVVLQKFGMLPANFKISAALHDLTINSITGFYDFTDQTMYLLNWITPDVQRMVMAHELTHALQDQNFHPIGYMAPPQTDPEPRMSMLQDDAADVPIARRAVIEGQASLVGFDYSLKDMGVNLADSPEARQRAEAYLQASYDSPITIDDAPRLLREIMIFPYREGLEFELQLIAHGGRQEAFRETFKRPPLDTHQILQPEAYLAHEQTPLIRIGDLAPVFGNAYQAYDSGSIGELDVQIMSEEFGRENDIYTVARKWDGGSYVVVKRAGLPVGAPLSAADLALVYLSRWKSREAAERFGQIYLQGIAKRLPMGAATEQSCDQPTCNGPLWEEHAISSEGPVHAELWPGNLLLITQSVDDSRMPALRSILLAHAQSTQSNAVSNNAVPDNAVQGSSAMAGAGRELASRLLDLPQFQALSEQAGLAIDLALRRQFVH